MNCLKEIIFDTLIDGIKLLPFLFFAFLIIELIEHKFDKKTKKIITKSGKYGPIIGSLLGLVPQCGFSVVAANLYITRVISLGTMFSIYLATSDEMIPVMISHNVSIKIIVTILIIKLISGMFFGFIIDRLFFRKTNNNYNYEICDKEHCDCKHSIFISSLKHTFKTFIFIILVSFVLNAIMEYFGSKLVSNIFMKNSLFGPFIGSLIGLIPNCASSVILTELFLQNVINFGTCIAGLVSGCGIALIVLFKTNKNIKENLFILLSLYLIGVLVGIIVNLMGIII